MKSIDLLVPPQTVEKGQPLDAGIIEKLGEEIAKNITVKLKDGQQEEEQQEEEEQEEEQQEE